MSWVTIDRDKCNGCGICAERCARCFFNKGGEITVNADEECCNLCGHCVSLCPTGAIVHHKMNMDNFIPIEGKITFDSEEFFQFVRQRRSHRHYKRKEVPLEDIEKLVDLCRYTPTGGNRQVVEIRIIQNKERIKRLSDLTVDYFMDLIGQVQQKVDRLRSEGKEIPEDLLMTHDSLRRYETMGTARDFGFDVIFHHAPALMIFHSGAQVGTPKDDCVIAAQTVVLAAMTMGLETCYIGLFDAAANSYAPVLEELNLPAGNRVYSVLVLGYPRLKFLRTVDRNPIRVEWE
jgi:nitroreductase/NAD-dependent dihydropyrimidine dehydrogenase PreA subunit